MRISTNDIFNIGSLAVVNQQAEMMKTQQQVSSGMRMNSPSDDPVAASQALRLRQAGDLNAQYQANQKTATGTLAQVDSALGAVTNLLQDVRTSAVAAGNTSLSDSDRQAIAQDIAGRLDQLIGLANADDGKGSYLFGGYSDTSGPFTKINGPGGFSVQYNGDQGARALQVSDTRTIDVTVNGDSVFRRIPTGNGTFATSAAAPNVGTGVISQGQVTNPAALLLGHSYQVVFTVVGVNTTYTVNDITAGAPVAGQVNQPFTSGNAISFNGVQFDISGQPANADVFNVTPTTSQDVFTTLQNLVTALNTPVGNAAGRAALTNSVAAALRNIDNAYNTALSVRAVIGARMNDVDSLQTVAGNQETAIKTELSKVEDVDYAAAISQLSKQQLILQAAQKSFVSVSELSLFKYI